MKEAWGGKVWEKGFKMIITHNTGNELREAAAMMLAENITSLNHVPGNINIVIFKKGNPMSDIIPLGKINDHTSW